MAINIRNLWPVSIADLFMPDHDMDYDEGDRVAFVVPSGREYTGEVVEVCDRDSWGDVWLRVSYTIAIGDTAYTVSTWLCSGSVELISKNEAA